jgi:hypothetical protein
MSEIIETKISNSIAHASFLPVFSAYFEYGRHGLFEILRINNIGKGDRVLIPDFICLEVLGPIYTLGAHPIYYSVTEQLIAKDLPINKSIKAVVAVNYFGFSQDLNVFRKYSSENKVILIEDNAHGFLSKDTSGKWLGTRSEFGFFSLRKTFSTIDGGALWLKNSTRFPETLVLEPFTSKIPFRLICKEILNSIQVKTRIPISFAFDSIYRYFRYLRTGHYFPLVNNEFEKLMPDIRPLHTHILNKITNSDIISECIRRRNLFYRVKNILSDTDISPIYDELPVGTVPYGYPFRTSEDKLKKVRKKIAGLGLYPVKWPDLPSNVISYAPEYYKNVYIINFI